MLWKYCAYILSALAFGMLSLTIFSIIKGDLNLALLPAVVTTALGLGADACRREYNSWVVYLHTPETVGTPYRDDETYKAQVPFMITRDMHQRLADLGFSKAERSSLTPEEAHKILGD